MDKKIPRVEIVPEECKGCELCISECPKDVISMSDKFNQFGYNYAVPTSPDDCIGCGFCFYACPEPGTVTVYKK
jgi:NAD-dependent dihydropyrimidine dehydrogenase PreA subunit